MKKIGGYDFSRLFQNRVLTCFNYSISWFYLLVHFLTVENVRGFYQSEIIFSVPAREISYKDNLPSGYVKIAIENDHL